MDNLHPTMDINHFSNEPDSNTSQLFNGLAFAFFFVFVTISGILPICWKQWAQWMECLVHFTNTQNIFYQIQSIGNRSKFILNEIKEWWDYCCHSRWCLWFSLWWENYRAPCRCFYFRLFVDARPSFPKFFVPLMWLLQSVWFTLILLIDCNRVHFSTVSLTCPYTATISGTMVSRTMTERMKPVEKRFEQNGFYY